MNKIMATAALLVATTAAMAPMAWAAPGWHGESTRGHERQRAYVSGPVHGAGRYGHYVTPPREYHGHAWHRGDRFVPHGGRVEVLRGHGYGYGSARLYGPPRGARWVRVDNDALLTAIATGVVLDVVYNLQF